MQVKRDNNSNDGSIKTQTGVKRYIKLENMSVNQKVLDNIWKFATAEVTKSDGKKK